MNVLFLGYWGANDGLSQSTINPHLRILTEFNHVHKIIYVSIEREGGKSFKVPDHSKIKHQPFKTISGLRILVKAYDFLILPFYIKKLIKQNEIHLIMCRSSLAGGIGYLVYRMTKIPFTVESFEPHADYMTESGVWKKSSYSYRIQKWFEQKQKRHADKIIPLTNRYKELLICEGVKADKVLVMPCAVDVEVFKFSRNNRDKIRERLRIPDDAIVGIYVGKFGDIYFDKEAFRLFKSAFDYFDAFHLILLNPQHQVWINEMCEEVSIPMEKVYHYLVPHNEVPQYLSASDFAFSLHKPTKFSYAFSPIKNGEYWANGLPILIPKGIGDDSNIIVKNKAGLIFDSDTELDWSQLNIPSINGRLNNSMVELAHNYRSIKTVMSIYKNILENVSIR